MYISLIISIQYIYPNHICLSLQRGLDSSSVSMDASTDYVNSSSFNSTSNLVEDEKLVHIITNTSITVHVIHSNPYRIVLIIYCVSVLYIGNNICTFTRCTCR